MVASADALVATYIQTFPGILAWQLFKDIQMHIHHELGEALLIFLTRFRGNSVSVVSKSNGVQYLRPILDETKDKRT